MRIVTVDRSKLLDGLRTNPTECVLLNRKGESCVLGFYALQALGLPSSLLTNQTFVSEPLFGVAAGMPEVEWLKHGVEDSICHANDEPGGRSGWARERSLKKLFKIGDIDLRFVGRRPRV